MAAPRRACSAESSSRGSANGFQARGENDRRLRTPLTEFSDQSGNGRWGRTDDGKIRNPRQRCHVGIGKNTAHGLVLRIDRHDRPFEPPARRFFMTVAPTLCGRVDAPMTATDFGRNM